jgi:transcriptional regulator with XRE-family HTH domain
MSKKTSAKMSKDSNWPDSIKALRKAADMNQGAFAKALGVAQSLVSACEGGDKIPSSDLFVRLGNFASGIKLYKATVSFWRGAGVKVEGMVPVVKELLSELDAPITQGKLTGLPPSKSISQESEKGRRLPFADSLLPNPAAAAYIKVVGDFLLPMFKDGDALVIDESETRIWSLVGSYVAMFRHTKGLHVPDVIREKLSDAEVARYPQLARYPDRTGLFVGWLRSQPGETTTLMLETPSRLGGTNSELVAFEIAPISGGSVRRRIELPGFAVLGRVIALIDMRGKSLPRGDAKK